MSYNVQSSTIRHCQVKRHIWKIGGHFLFSGKERIEEFDRGISKTVESVSLELSSSEKSEGQTRAVRLMDGLQLELHWQKWTVSAPRASGKVAVAHTAVLEIIRN